MDTAEGFIFGGALVIEVGIAVATLLWCRAMVAKLPDDLRDLRRANDWVERGVILGLWAATVGIVALFVLVTRWLARVVL